MDAIPQNLKIALPVAGAALALGLSAGSLELPEWLRHMAEQWGPGFAMVFAVFAGTAYYVPRNVVKDFVTAQQGQAIAMASISRSLEEMSGQSGKLETKLDMILAYQEEMKINLSVGADRFKRLEEKLLYEAEHHS